MDGISYSYYGPKILVTIPTRPSEVEEVMSNSKVGELGRILQDLVGCGPETNVWFTIPTTKGYGNAIRENWAERQHDIHFGEKGYDMYLLWDNDFATPATEAPRFVDKILWEQYDVVVGDRQGRLDNPRQMMRGILSGTINKVISLTFTTGMHEHFSGFRAYSRRFVEEILPECSEPHWMFQPESSIVAQKLGLRVTEIPVPYDNTIRPTKLTRFPKDMMDILPGYFRLVMEWK